MPWVSASLGRIALEEALVDLVKEGLLFGESGGVFSAYFDGLVEAVEWAQEFVAVESPLGQFDNDLFDFGGHDVAAGEVGVVENSLEDALGEQVLDQHALDGIFGEIGIDGLAAEGVEVVEAADEGGAAAALFVDDLLDGGG